MTAEKTECELPTLGGSTLSIDHVDALGGEATLTPIDTHLRAPRSVRPALAKAPWFPQLDVRHLLDVTDAYVGNNIVFTNERWYDLGRWWLTAGQHHYTEVLHHFGEAWSLGSWRTNMWQHFVHGVGPQISAALELFDDERYPEVILTEANSPTAQWFWRELGLSDRVVHQPGRHGPAASVDRAVAIGWSSRRRDYGAQRLHDGLAYGVGPHGGLAPLRERLGAADSPGDTVLYLSRRACPSRHVENERDVVTAIAATIAGTGLNLELFESQGDHAADRDRFRRARLVIGPHGSSFANMLFCGPETEVIEFQPLHAEFVDNGDILACNWGFAEGCGFRYWTIPPQRFGHRDATMLVDPFEVAATVHAALEDDL